MARNVFFRTHRGVSVFSLCDGAILCGLGTPTFKLAYLKNLPRRPRRSQRREVFRRVNTQVYVSSVLSAYSVRNHLFFEPAELKFSVPILAHPDIIPTPHKSPLAICVIIFGGTVPFILCTEVWRWRSGKTPSSRWFAGFGIRAGAREIF